MPVGHMRWRKAEDFPNSEVATSSVSRDVGGEGSGRRCRQGDLIHRVGAVWGREMFLQHSVWCDTGTQV